MSKFKQKLAARREARINQILNEPITGLLAKGSFKKALAITAVVSSWVYFINFLIPLQISNLPVMSIQGLVGRVSMLLMGISFLLMRRSVRRITSLPDKYLDELQIENRDWAFSMGYLIVRRVGLAVSIALFVFLSAISLWNQVYYSMHPLGNPVDPIAQTWMVAFDAYLKSFFELSSLGSLSQLFGLLTYVAYSFPIILLTWRDSKFNEEVKLGDVVVPEWAAIIRRLAKGYFFRLKFLGAAVALVTLWVWLVNLTRAWGFGGNLFILALFYTIGYALYVFGWGLIKQWYVVKLMSTSTVSEPARSIKPTVYLLFTLTSIAGASVGLVMVSVLFFYPLIGSASGGFLMYALIAGVVTLVLHVVAFVQIGTIGKSTTAVEK